MKNATYPYTSTRTGPGLLIDTPWVRASYNVVGRFTIYQLGVSTFGRVDSIAVDFEQRCSPSAPSLVGSFRFNSTRSELRPFPSSSPAALLGDFNGDGRVDLVWPNRADGRLAAWFMNGTLATDNTFTDTSRIKVVIETADSNASIRSAVMSVLGSPVEPPELSALVAN